MLTVNSGQPFDITTGQDLYGDTLSNSRPGLATDPNTPGVIRTSYGLLDPNPSAHEQILPHNYGRGPGIVMANLRVGKNFTFGRPREPGTAVSSGGNGPPRGLTTGPFSTAAGSQSTGGASSRRYSLSMARSSAISRHPFSVRRTSPMGRASWAGLDSRSQPITGGLNCKHVSPSDRTSKVEQLGENARRPLRAGSNKLEDSDLNGEVYHDRR